VNAKVVAIVYDGPVCGGCRWWRFPQDNAAECFHNPPVARVLKDGSVDMCRPITEADEPACAMFKGKH